MGVQYVGNLIYDKLPWIAYESRLGGVRKGLGFGLRKGLGLRLGLGLE
jgi:hypothetical protein